MAAMAIFIGHPPSPHGGGEFEPVKLLIVVMCGRYASFLPAEALAQLFGTVNPLPNLKTVHGILAVASLSRDPHRRNSPTNLWLEIVGAVVGIAAALCGPVATCQRTRIGADRHGKQKAFDLSGKARPKRRSRAV
jgi:hypothetical protein